jgi:transportin-3
MSGTTAPQAEQVSLALKSLSSNVSRDEKERANNFLESFQKSADSWSVVLVILDQGSTAGDDVKIFAAQTLRSKVSFLGGQRVLTML